jgi:FAD/FMN-containing dehydrogenase
MKELSGWGRFPKIKTTELMPDSESQLLEILRHSESFIARGNGRSYGDSSINKDLTITMTRMNRFLQWNQESGELIAESGVLIADVVDKFLPRGWFPYVTPGTKFITLGGAIACDVHGKNHHLEGSFGNHVNWFDIVNEKNEIVRCSKSENADLFHWTIGGMGLTGVIVRCSIQLKKIESGWIKQRVIVNHNLKDTLQSFYDRQNATYSVAWIDCLAQGKSFGRSILMLGEHANANEVTEKNSIFPERKHQKISFFFDTPSFLLNNMTVSLFNKFYFNLNKNKKSSYVDWDSYFYPLDAIGDWNRMYGKKGFFQFQCLLSNESSAVGYKRILSVIQKKSSGSFLSVLKQFGSGNKNLSFPKEGFTLALDFKATDKNIRVAKELTEIVNDLGGSIYLAKDALMDPSEFDSQINSSLKEEFSKFRNTKIESEQVVRIKL